ncbi:MAG TPA: BRCT domain-containing protein [Planctomycetota bacterium]|nr:BRCT domain-containing protein [Planctomycetota bacterium]
MKSDLSVILAIIVLAILSIVFGVMAYLNFKTIDPGDGKPLQAQIDERQNHIDETVRSINDLQVEKDALSEKLAKAQQDATYYSGEGAAYVQAAEARNRLKAEGQAFEDQAKNMGTTVSAGKKKVSDAIQAEITRERTEMEQKVEELTAKKAKVQADTLAKKADFDVAAKRHVQDMNYVKSQLGDAKAILSDLTTREEVRGDITNRIDGHVVLSNVVNNIVVIDIGSGVGVKNGFRFEVFSIEPGKKHVTKAYIEVVKAGPTSSECTVIQRPMVLPSDELTNYVAEQPEFVYNPYSPGGKKTGSAEPMTGGRVVMSGQKINNPIMEGDYVQNPFFEAGRRLVFYIAGSKEMVGERQKSAIRYSAGQIKDVAERYGAKIVDAVDTNVNYVIAQKHPEEDPEYKKAVDLGIPVIFEWELFRFLDNN